MPCKTFLEFSLDHDWDKPMRRRAVEMLAHLETCPDCQAGILEDDRIREALGAFKNSAEPPDGWDCFERRVSGTPPDPLPRERMQLRFRAGWLAMAAALAITAGGVFEVGKKLTHHRPVAVTQNPVQAPVTRIAFAPPELGREVDAFRQMSQVFDGRAGWMLVSDEANDVGVTASGDMPAHQIMLLRLTLTHDGLPASDADLLVVPGQSATLTVPLDSGRLLHYRIGTSSQDPTRLSVFLEMKTRRGGETLAAMSGNLRLQPGEEMSAGVLNTMAGAYELKIGSASAELAENKP